VLKEIDMAQLQEPIRRLNQLDVSGQDKRERYKAADALWQYSPYEKELTDDRVRNDYVLALFSIANAFSSEQAIAPLERAYSIDRGHFDYGVKGSAKEYAAYSIGRIYERLGSYHSAARWFRRSLELAQSVGIRENTLVNLGALGRTLEFLALHEQSGRYYDQVLSMLASSPPEADDHRFLIPAAMHHVLHGDQARGEALLREWIAAHLGQPSSRRLDSKSLEPWAYEALHYLGMHYVATGRPRDAINLAQTLEIHRPSAVDARNTRHHELVARAFLQLGQLDRALEELAHVHAVHSPGFDTARGGGVESLELWVESLELWIDVARIHAAKHNHDEAIAAYVVLAYSLGALVADHGAAPTVRLRFYWLQQMAVVVHEMVWAWITIGDTQTRSRHETTVGNALLQLKGNLFIAVGFNRGSFGSLKYELFTAARAYAVAARKAMSKPDDQNALLELEEALRKRENVEGSLLTAEVNPSPAMAAIFSRDFRWSSVLTTEMFLLDYSLVRYQPPRNGMAGPVQGLRYISVGLTAGRVRVIDLGEAEQIEKLCRPLIRALSTQPTDNDGSSSGPHNRRQLRLGDRDQRQTKFIDHRDLAKRVYERIVAPFEPLPRSLLFSADGMLAALPFHALIRDDDRYLVRGQGCRVLLLAAAERGAVFSAGELFHSGSTSRQTERLATG
jgi:tetratricopeptide (TPR) repeat protein